MWVSFSVSVSNEFDHVNCCCWIPITLWPDYYWKTFLHLQYLWLHTKLIKLKSCTWRHYGWKQFTVTNLSSREGIQHWYKYHITMMNYHPVQSSLISFFTLHIILNNNDFTFLHSKSHSIPSQLCFPAKI